MYEVDILHHHDDGKPFTYHFTDERRAVRFANAVEALSRYSVLAWQIDGAHEWLIVRNRTARKLADIIEAA